MPSAGRATTGAAVTVTAALVLFLASCGHGGSHPAAAAGTGSAGPGQDGPGQAGPQVLLRTAGDSAGPLLQPWEGLIARYPAGA